MNCEGDVYSAAEEVNLSGKRTFQGQHSGENLMQRTERAKVAEEVNLSGKRTEVKRKSQIGFSYSVLI